jgi:uncharacterized protein
VQVVNNEILFSASDFVGFTMCEHLTALDLVDLETPLPRALDSDEALLIQDRGRAHEARFIAQSRDAGGQFIDITAVATNLQEKIDATRDAMRRGFDVIYQASLRDGELIGHTDFLRKVPRPSALGAFSYEIIDTKLARSAKVKFVIQLAFYSHLLAKAQGVEPLRMRVVLGDMREESFRYADYSRYFATLLERFLAR